jgi:hypothetical protein
MIRDIKKQISKSKNTNKKSNIWAAWPEAKRGHVVFQSYKLHFFAFQCNQWKLGLNYLFNFASYHLLLKLY